MRRALLTAIFLVLPCALYGQSTGTAKWTQAEGQATAQQYVYVLKNSNVTTAVTLTQTCSTGTPTNCTAPVPAALLVPGSFTVTVTCGTAPGCVGSTVSPPFVVGSPAVPGSLVITVP